MPEAARFADIAHVAQRGHGQASQNPVTILEIHESKGRVLPMSTARICLTAGAVFGLLGVAGGAMGAHWLRNILDPGGMNTFEIGIRYQMYHALALLATGFLAGQRRSAWFTRACWLFTAGVVLFSGSLYSLAFTGIGLFGAVAPLGGVCLIAGWAALVVGALGHRDPDVSR